MKKEQKKLLPPFLMIRSGLINDFMVAATVTAGAGALDFTYSDNKDLGAGTFLVFMLTFLFATVKTMGKLGDMKQDIEQVTSQMQEFKDGCGDLRISGLQNPRMAQRIVQHMSKQDPAYFNKMVKNPMSIQNEVLERDIAIGHLRAHPRDAKLLQNTNVNIKSLPRGLYRKVMRANRSR